MYSLLYGSYPFNRKPIIIDDFDFENEENFIDFDINPELNISEEARDLIKCMLNRDPGLRSSAQQALNHPFFQLYPNPPFQNDDDAQQIFQLLNQEQLET